MYVEDRDQQDRGRSKQIQRKVKEDENGVGIAGARSFSLNTRAGDWGSKQCILRQI